jgi:hypothetical protein
MASELIKKHLEELKGQKKFDDGFIDLLADSNQNSEEGSTTADKVIELIEKRYVESKQNKA